MTTTVEHELFAVQFSWGGYTECSCGQIRPESEAEWEQHLAAAGATSSNSRQEES